MNKILIDGPLDKNNLKQILKSEPSLKYLGESVKTAKGTIKYDGVVLDSVTDIKIAVKLKEPRHYVEPFEVMRNDEDRWAANKSEYKVVEIPYFIQLDDQTFTHYFGREPVNRIITDELHGFHNLSLIPPANFCSMGVNNFMKELGDLPSELFGEVYDSLLDRSFCKNGDPFLTFPIDMLDDEFWEMLEDDGEEEEDSEEN
jgi:hypothetical protein